MTDRELLEKAAKAVGITLRDNWGNFLEVDERGCCHCWFPLTNDAQALRLAVTFEVDLSFYSHPEPVVYAVTKHMLGIGTDGHASYQQHAYQKVGGADMAAATRRAIVLAVVELADRISIPSQDRTMNDLLRKIEAARVRTAEDAVVASIPAELMENARKADAAFKASGGCSGCSSQVIGVHHGACPSMCDDFF